MYQGILDGLRVRVVRLRRHHSDTGTKKVRFSHRYPPSQPSSINHTGPLQRCCNLETLEAPECCAPVGCHHLSLSVDLGLDAWWRNARIYQEKH